MSQQVVVQAEAPTASREPSEQRLTAAELLVDIVELWDRLHVPLLHRSRFVVAHRGLAPFFFQTELAHLQDLDRRASSHARARSAAQHSSCRAELV